MEKPAENAFEKTWSSDPGLRGWFAEVNNQPLGKRFMVTAFTFFCFGGVLALLMRLQLTSGDLQIIAPDLYNQLLTMHGSTMMYLFAVPFIEGLALYLLPMMIGSRDVAFPRLTAFSYWAYLFGGILFYSSFLVGAVPDAGWFAYTPLSGPKYSGLGIDFWLLGLTMVEIAGLTAGVEIVVTILKFRAPGMTISRMPLLVWTLLVMGVMILFAFSVLLVATILLELDRALGTQFFNPLAGGSTLLWQHLFWFFGHPEVYIIFLPATGIVSMVVATFARRPVAAYLLVVVAIVLIGFVSFGLWVHHMFTTGLPELAMSFFTAASLMIGVASGIQIFSWIATLWGTRPAWRAAFLWIMGFIFVFVLGGLTGVMVAVVPFDMQVHDTYFIVAHLHYVLIGGAVFPVYAGLHFWLPKITGRMLSERLGAWSFWLTFVGFNVTFFPMHLMGLVGLPRRVYTYSPTLGLDGMNLAATLGSFVMGLGFVLIVLNVWRSLKRGAMAGDDPWGGETLEWSVSSPPPSYSFRKPPVVSGRSPMWQRDPVEKPLSAEVARAVTGMDSAPSTWRATLTSDPLTAEPQGIQYLSRPTMVPLVAALGLLVAMLGILSQLYLLAPLGGVVLAGALARWLYPDKRRLEQMQMDGVVEAVGLPVFSTGVRSTAWWGMLCLLTILGMAVGTLVFCYYYLWLFSETWPQENLPLPELGFAGLAFAILVSSGVAVALVSWAMSGNKRRTGLALLAAGFGGGVAFMVLLMVELIHLPFAPQANAYASIFYLVAWVLLAFVLIATLLAGTAWYRLKNEGNWNHPFQQLHAQLLRMFWVFTAGVGALMYLMLYLSPRIL
jgi:cytochrome c oxidase subunit I+III